MSDKEIIPFGAAIASDVLSAFQIPGGGTLAKLADKWLEKRRRKRLRF